MTSEPTARTRAQTSTFVRDMTAPNVPMVEVTLPLRAATLARIDEFCKTCKPGEMTRDLALRLMVETGTEFVQRQSPWRRPRRRLRKRSAPRLRVLGIKDPSLVHQENAMIPLVLLLEACIVLASVAFVCHRITSLRRLMAHHANQASLRERALRDALIRSTDTEAWLAREAETLLKALKAGRMDRVTTAVPTPSLNGRARALGHREVSEDDSATGKIVRSPQPPLPSTSAEEPTTVMDATQLPAAPHCSDSAQDVDPSLPPASEGFQVAPRLAIPPPPPEDPSAGVDTVVVPLPGTQNGERDRASDTRGTCWTGPDSGRTLLGVGASQTSSNSQRSIGEGDIARSWEQS